MTGRCCTRRILATRTRLRRYDSFCHENPMTPLLTGINHIAILTEDLNRFVDFYTVVFDAQMVFAETVPGFRHAILRLGSDSWLHPAQITGNSHGAALPATFNRGHLDHIALTAGSAEGFEIVRHRLIVRGASNGSIEDFGAFHSLRFEDPDGMHAEMVLIVDPALRGIHAPLPLRNKTN